MSPPGARGLARCPSHAVHIKGPVSFLNPTIGFVEASGSGRAAIRRSRSHHRDPPEDGRGSVPPIPSRAHDMTTTTATGAGSTAAADGATEKPAPGVVFHVWQTRNNRKGRHAVAVRVPSHPAATGLELPIATNAPKQVMRGIGRMVTRYPVWDVSYDVAIMFTIGKSFSVFYGYCTTSLHTFGYDIYFSDTTSSPGSVIWVINGFFAWLPLQSPSSAFAGETTLGGGITAFIGATVFELGSVLLMLEAVNENRTDCFGWALEKETAAAAAAAAEEEEEHVGNGRLRLRPHPSRCVHHHRDKRSFLSSRLAKNDGVGDDEKGNRAWEWWPTWNELTTHYLREIGFLACLSQFLGATVFWISGFTGLPPILDALSTAATDGIFWLPQVVGGLGFIASGCLFMLEVQPNWHTPAPRVLGWHIGLWNLVGALGFTACGALGFAAGDAAVEYASTLATFIGSWAFLIGSVIQWYESLDKYPVVLRKSTPTTDT
ncbi:hypothetical protein PG985_002849 [Apiospora marii]|uniref:uncharacterized protein n=1 Tax=Apiospora marii TaxID=335849 RepID=UPI00312CD1D5